MRRRRSDMKTERSKSLSTSKGRSFTGSTVTGQQRIPVTHRTPRRDHSIFGIFTWALHRIVDICVNSALLGPVTIDEIRTGIRRILFGHLAVDSEETSRMRTC